MSPALGVTLDQLGNGWWPAGLVFTNKWRREGPVLLASPAQHKVVPPADEPVKAIQTCRALCYSVRLGRPASSWAQPTQGISKKAVHPLDRILAVPLLKGFSPEASGCPWLEPFPESAFLLCPHDIITTDWLVSPQAQTFPSCPQERGHFLSTSRGRPSLNPTPELPMEGLVSPKQPAGTGPKLIPKYNTNSYCKTI